MDEEGSHESILKPGVTLQQILDSFSESDDVEYQRLVDAMEKAYGGGDDDNDETENEANSADKHSHYFSYLEKPLYHLIDKLELEDANPFQDFDRDSPTVLVDGGYLVLEKWAGVFTKVFTKYGDISGNVIVKMLMSIDILKKKLNIVFKLNLFSSGSVNILFYSCYFNFNLSFNGSYK